jgi:outer membrane protein assembly factor BamE (lipoprotein component of BamABCDE complex)
VNTSKGLIAALATLLGIGLILLLIFGGLAALFFISFDTQYAPGYSEKKFKSIKPGDTEQTVVSLLGEPFSTEDAKPYVEWIYAAEDQRRFADTGEGSGTYTTIRFDSEGRVVSIGGVVQTSASTFSFGDGLNYLKLTGTQIDKLKGSSQNEIKKQFGPPVATYQDKTSKFLRYSKSPSSSNYHLRAIGVDENGKVVRIWREIYWD